VCLVDIGVGADIEVDSSHNPVLTGLSDVEGFYWSLNGYTLIVISRNYLLTSNISTYWFGSYAFPIIIEHKFHFVHILGVTLVWHFHGETFLLVVGCQRMFQLFSGQLRIFHLNRLLIWRIVIFLSLFY